MSAAKDVTPDADHGGAGGEPCSLDPSVCKGRYEIIQECQYEPGQFWDVICDGPVNMTSPLFTFFGDHHITGNNEIDLDQTVHGNVEIDLNQTVHGNVEIDLDQTVHGNVEIDLNQTVHGNVEIDLNQTVHGNVEIDLNQTVHGFDEVEEHQILHKFLELRPSTEPPCSPRPPEGPQLTTRLWFAEDGAVRMKTTFWPLLSSDPDVWAPAPQTCIALLGDCSWE